jgi:nucleoid DNA-binding protein
MQSLHPLNSQSVREKKDVKISDFGSFQSVHAKARSGTNPSTGASIVIPAKERIRFKPFAAFKSVINK